VNDASHRPPIMLMVSSLTVGGAERHTVTLANRLAEQFTVDVVYLKPATALLGEIDRQRVRSVTCLDVRAKLDPRAVWRLRRLFDACGTRLVLCTNMYPLLYAQLAGMAARRRPAMVEVFHTTIVRDWRDRLQLAAYAPFLDLDTRFVFISEAQREYWTRRGLRTDAVTIHNGVDVDRYTGDPGGADPVAVRAELGFADRDYVVGICAVLRPEKAHHHLLEAVARLRDEGVAWRVLIVGDGPSRPDIERATDRLGLLDDVRITGMVDDVRPLVAACDLMALVSTAVETFSISALESMAMGKAMVMSDIGGAREQVDDGVHGAVFPPGDIDALCRCLRYARDRDRLAAMGRAARDRVVEEFSETRMIDRYAALTRRLLGEH
jgi:glycosyltransferase involved in cell wall biosynthesis